jgi:RNA polymerase sigma-70 factor (ECF subfamily)
MTDRHTSRRLSDWFRQWRVPLRKFLTGKGAVRAADLDDVAQEVFLRLMRYDQTGLIEHPQAYLFKVAVNVSAEWAIRGRHMQFSEPQRVQELVDEQAILDRDRQLDLQDEVERALLSLTLPQRKVMKLQFFEGMSRSEIAAHLAITERSVKRIQAKSFAKLRLRLDPELLRDISDGRE